MDNRRTEPLPYAKPRRHRDSGFSAALSVLVILAFFAMSAVLCMDGVNSIRRAAVATTTLDARADREAAIKFFVCSAILFLPAVWYGRALYRGK